MVLRCSRGTILRCSSKKILRFTIQEKPRRVTVVYVVMLHACVTNCVSAHQTVLPILPSGCLQIPNVSRNDEGVYQCTAYNPAIGTRVSSPTSHRLSVLRKSNNCGLLHDGEPVANYVLMRVFSRTLNSPLKQK